MTEEKQEGQKTVVSFIVGLLIGGLLVWAFSGPAADAPDSKVDGDKIEKTDGETDVKEGSKEDAANNDVSNDSSSSETSVADKAPVEKAVLEVGEGDIKLAAEQSVGTSIPLESATYPVKEGWIGVRSYNNGQLGSLLGVVRFSEEQGLVPSDIILQYPTTSGNEYAVVIYSESGDRKFNLAEDVQIDKIFSTFKVK